MLACNRLRIDPGNGSPAVEYRIGNGFVESRIEVTHTATKSVPAIEKPWQRLTPQQLTSRVLADTVVAHWLSRRMGLHQLISACNEDSSSSNSPDQGISNQTAA